MPIAYDPSHAEAARPFFDATYYRATNPDLAAQGTDPLVHFLTTGWLEGRNPSAAFDVGYYLRSNPDVAEAGINPLVHYAWRGAIEGRLTRRPMDSARREIEKSRSARARSTEWGNGLDDGTYLARAALFQRLAASVTAARTIVLSVSHDDHERNVGGVQNVVRHERAGFEQMGHAYLHLSPASPRPMLAELSPDSEFKFHLRLGAEPLGLAKAADLLDCLAELAGGGTRLMLVVHHCMGHAPELLAAIAALCASPPIVWAHDSFAFCSSYNLLRNDVSYCGAPPVGSAGCGICCYGAERPSHVRRMRGFFEAVDPILLAPSQAALDVWRRWDFPCREIAVQPLARLVFSADDADPPRAVAGQPLRVAHIGIRILSKGWPVFEELALRLAGDPGFRFYHFGINQGAARPGAVRHVDVRVTREQPDRMIEALAEHRIDVVVSWSLCPETYCFAAYEALAAGAFLLGRAAPGNVGAIIASVPEQGRVVSNEAALFSLFEGGEIARLMATAGRRRGVLLAEHGAATWLRSAWRRALPRRFETAIRPDVAAGSRSALVA